MVPAREETVYAWKLEERGDSNATKAERAILVQRIRNAEVAADKEREGGGARRGGRGEPGRPLPGTRPITLERRVVDVYAEVGGL